MSDWTLNLGDCLQGMAGLADKSVDHVITDVPYDDAGTHAAHASSVVARRSLGFEGLASGAELARIIGLCSAKTRRWIITTCDWRHVGAIDEAGLLVRFGVWVKPNGAPQFTGDRPGTGWEPIAICHPPGRKRWNGGGRHGVWEYAIEQGEHPTQKPLRLMEALIRDFTDPGDLILDPFAGSGTTLCAAKRLSRRAIGWEKDPAFHAAAVKRIEATEEGAIWCPPRSRKPRQASLLLDPETT